MTTDTVPHTIQIKGEDVTVDAKLVAPGLFLYWIPDDVHPTSPERWRIGHESGLVIASAMTEADAYNGVEVIMEMIDWTRDTDSIQALIDPVFMYRELHPVGCHHPTIGNYV